MSVLDYDRLERDASQPRKVVNHRAAWDKLQDITEADDRTRELVERFCADKRISFIALAALRTRIKHEKHGRVDLAFAGRGQNGDITAIKYRPTTGTSHDSYTAKPSVWVRPIVLGPEGSLDWLIAEGETDGARLYDLAGDRCAVMVLPAGANTFQREWADIIPRGARIALCHDADEAGDKGAKKAAAILGGRTFRLRPPVEGADWCDWTGDRDEFVCLARDALCNALHNPTHRFYTPEELLDFPAADWLVEPFLIHNGFSVLYGPSGTFKSFCALDWAARAPGTAVMLAAESSPKNLGQRIQAWEEAAGQKSGIVSIPYAVDLAAEAKSLIEDMLPLNPSVVIVDTLSRNSGGMDENSTQDMARLVGAMDEIRARVGCALLGLHHTGHAETGRERGSSVLRAAADVSILATPADHLQVKLSCSKMRDGEPFQPATVRLERVAQSLVACRPVTVVDEVFERVAAYRAEHPGASQNEVEEAVPGPRAQIRLAYRECEVRRSAPFAAAHPEVTAPPEESPYVVGDSVAHLHADEGGAA